MRWAAKGDHRAQVAFVAELLGLAALTLVRPRTRSAILHSVLTFHNETDPSNRWLAFLQNHRQINQRAGFLHRAAVPCNKVGRVSQHLTANHRGRRDGRGGWRCQSTEDIPINLIANR